MRRFVIAACVVLGLAFLLPAPIPSEGDVYSADPKKSPLVLAARKASPSVVSIGSTETRYYRRRLQVDDWFAPSFLLRLF